MIIRLPWPDSALMPNRKNGKHWGASLDAKVNALEYAYMATKAAGTFTPGDGAIPISILFLEPDKRRRDLDNLLASMKPAIDGIAKALNVDDHRFSPILLDRATGPKYGAVVVAVGVTIQSFQELHD